MTFSYELSHLAQSDLDEIWIYTFENWSEQQADHYFNLILDEIESICLHPLIGRSIEKIKPQHRIKKIKSHLIIYKIVEDVLFIDRILHSRMDIENHLTE